MVRVGWAVSTEALKLWARAGFLLCATAGWSLLIRVHDKHPPHLQLAALLSLDYRVDSIQTKPAAWVSSSGSCSFTAGPK